MVSDHRNQITDHWSLLSFQWSSYVKRVTVSSRGILGSDAVWLCGRIPTFQRPQTLHSVTTQMTSTWNITNLKSSKLLSHYYHYSKDEENQLESILFNAANITLRQTKTGLTFWLSLDYIFTQYIEHARKTPWDSMCVCVCVCLCERVRAVSYNKSLYTNASYKLYNPILHMHVFNVCDHSGFDEISHNKIRCRLPTMQSN
jgi:hypothetical protein